MLGLGRKGGQTLDKLETEKLVRYPITADISISVQNP